MGHLLTVPSNRAAFAHYLPERQEDVIIEALRLLDFNDDRPDAKELADALENDAWLCVTAEPRESIRRCQSCGADIACVVEALEAIEAGEF